MGGSDGNRRRCRIRSFVAGSRAARYSATGSVRLSASFRPEPEHVQAARRQLELFSQVNEVDEMARPSARGRGIRSNGTSRVLRPVASGRSRGSIYSSVTQRLDGEPAGEARGTVVRELLVHSYGAPRTVTAWPPSDPPRLPDCVVDWLAGLRELRPRGLIALCSVACARLAVLADAEAAARELLAVANLPALGAWPRDIAGRTAGLPRVARGPRPPEMLR